MSSMFESYEREYSELSHAIARQAGLVASLSGASPSKNHSKQNSLSVLSTYSTPGKEKMPRKVGVARALAVAAAVAACAASGADAAESRKVSARPQKGELGGGG